MPQEQIMVSQAFENMPEQLAGSAREAKLWKDLRTHFSVTPVRELTDLRDFIARVQRYTRDNVMPCIWICRDNFPLMAYVGIPVLCSRLIDLGVLDHGMPHFVMPVDLYDGNGSTITLRLPYELMPDLLHLRNWDYKMNDRTRHALDFKNLYFVSVFHYHGMPDLIDKYSLDVEEAHDRHYEFSVSSGLRICKQLHRHPKALVAALKDYLSSYGGSALEDLVCGKSPKIFHY